MHIRLILDLGKVEPGMVLVPGAVLADAAAALRQLVECLGAERFGAEAVDAWIKASDNLQSFVPAEAMPMVDDPNQIGLFGGDDG